MREFSVSSGGVTVAGATTLVFVNPPAAPNPNLEFLRFWVGQSANATSAQQRIQLETQASAFPTLTASTPVKLKPADPNASVITGGAAGAAGTAGINASAEGAGVKTPVWDDAFNVLNGWLHIPTPAETRIMNAGFAQGLGMFFPVAPATLTNWAFGLVFREV
ncbi:MAG TPA: hypothetical protein VHN11_07970 [Xanthobacteraceae bacterium]|jgi:hypothetical protein|nr:hypothetical protein [Xanthobacteraceae bacterium]